MKDLFEFVYMLGGIIDTTYVEVLVSEHSFGQ